MIHAEDQLQIACIRWFDFQHAAFSWALFHVPNGGKRNAKEAARFKAMGVRPGVPDLLFILPRGKYHYLAIELKVGRNKQTERQLQYEALINAMGGKYIVVRSLEEFINQVDEYLYQSGETPRPVCGSTRLK